MKQTIIILTAAEVAILLTALTYGISAFFIRKAPSYFKFLVCAVGCYTLSEFVWLAYYFCYEERPDILGVFSLGYFGCYLFILAAGCGVWNAIVDDGKKAYRKYRIIALSAPVVFSVAAILCYRITTGLTRIQIIAYLLMVVPKIISSYYNLKHLILPENGIGLLKGTRVCNLMALALYAGDGVCTYYTIVESATGVFVTMFFMPLCLLTMMIAGKRGYRKWIR